MKMRLCCVLVLLSTFALACIDCNPVSAQSAASKVEDLGQMVFLKVDTIRAVRRNNMLMVQAEIINMSNMEQRLYYRFKWLDYAGFTVGSEETWKPETIYGAQMKVLQTIAPVPEAVDFLLQLQSPDNYGIAPNSGE